MAFLKFQPSFWRRQRCFQFGILLATPTQERTIGEVFITALADWFKVMIGVVIPVLPAGGRY